MAADNDAAPDDARAVSRTTLTLFAIDAPRPRSQQLPAARSAASQPVDATRARELDGPRDEALAAHAALTKTLAQTDRMFPRLLDARAELRALDRHVFGGRGLAEHSYVAPAQTRSVGSTPESLAWEDGALRGDVALGANLALMQAAEAAAARTAEAVAAEVARSVAAMIANIVSTQRELQGTPQAAESTIAATSGTDAVTVELATHDAAEEPRAAPGEPAPSPAPEPCVAAPAEPTPKARLVSAQSPLFRAEALAAHRRGDRAASVLKITSVFCWSLLLAFAAALLVALTVVALAEVEERSAARGVLRSPFGVQPVVPLLAGRVREVLVTSSAQVSAGQVLVRLDTTPIEAERAEAAHRLAALTEQWNEQRHNLQTQFERSSSLTRARITLLERRQSNQQRRIARRDEQAQRIQAPELDAVVERAVREQSIEALEGARDDSLRLSDELSALRLQLATGRGTHQQALSAGDERVREARTKLDTANMLLQQTELRAPIAGKVESLRVNPGQTVQAGEWVARVVRDELPKALVAFVPERDAAFLRTGARAYVEVDKLPTGEFGLARAHVVRVGGELADASELAAALGDVAPKGPHVRVDLELDDTPETRKVRPFLRAGTVITARITLRDRRLLAIVFEPLRKWLE